MIHVMSYVRVLAHHIQYMGIVKKILKQIIKINLDYYDIMCLNC